MTRLFVSILAWALAATASAEEWPGWRGPRGDGTSTEKGGPLRWSKTENVRWKTSIPGKGHSSPIVWGDRVFVTTCIEEQQKRLLLCLDRRDGKLLWQQVVLTAKLERKHGLNSFASATPATDGKHVYVAFLSYPDMEVACYDFDGKLVWQKSPGKLLSQHGFCSSPILYKDTVILNGDQDAEAYLVALDKATGSERWRADRPNRTRSYCTPILYESPKRPGVTQLVLSGSKCVASYDADTGKQLWLIDGPTEQFVASLVPMDDVLCLTAGFPTYHIMGIRPDGSGNVTKTHVAWHHAELPAKEASYVPSPIAADGRFYVVSDLGLLMCLDAKTGKRLWMEQLGRHHSASPVLVDGHLFFPDYFGNTFVVKPGPKFELVAKNVLSEKTFASPAVAQGQMFVRTVDHLICIGAEK
jgi:outer membrane protein assembly factor BamB